MPTFTSEAGAHWTPRLATYLPIRDDLQQRKCTYTAAFDYVVRHHPVTLQTLYIAFHSSNFLDTFAQSTPHTKIHNEDHIFRHCCYPSLGVVRCDCHP